MTRTKLKIEKERIINLIYFLTDLATAGEIISTSSKF